ncbi:hypothetical protein D187_001818 [Cystobacter fuscus DSM 2262]|uniref:Uncharacterized protein n=1 Tax=Cystobacter fuscus (strain ATCC 25194 / DSM 2262 / NBRC 100088 / M29) TaxID=1242864 RepID=S9PB33_CYSF2|nr:hypothetical protein [Cystobacter fuscus]EPX60331.1 hypothetical protein D187_001818 [Cystobacter fuscus DSM 2262]
MNRFLGPASLAVSLLALTVAVWSPRGGDEAPAAPPPASPAPASAPQTVKDLELRVKMLEENALSLSRRLMLLEQRPAVAGAEGGGAAPAGLATEVEQLRSEVRSMVAGEALQSEGGREYLKGVMRSVQDEMRTEQRAQRQERMVQNMAQAQAQQAERVRRFATEARLSSTQERDVLRHLENESTRRQELFQAMQSGSEPQNTRQELRQLREQTDTQIKSLLDESQQAQYDQMRREERRGGRERGDGQGRAAGDGR